MTRLTRVAVLVIALVTALWVVAVLIEVQSYDVASLARTPPKRTALMRQREAEARARGGVLRLDQRWVPYERISPLLRRAVLVAEDDAFFAHGGLDFDELVASARRNLEERRIVRGGSTITQQLAKNLFLGDRRTPDRKLREALLAFRLERTLGKRRIFELYLNLIEWGDGIYGIEAASRRHFGVTAAALGPRPAVLLAAVIINPRRYSTQNPDRRIERRANMIATRLRRRGVLDSAGWAAAVGLPPPAPELATPDSVAVPGSAPASDSTAAPSEASPAGPDSGSAETA